MLKLSQNSNLQLLTNITLIKFIINLFNVYLISFLYLVNIYILSLQCKDKRNTNNLLKIFLIMKKQIKYTRIVLARVVEKQFSLKTIEVTYDFANFLDTEYKSQFGKHCSAYSCCWFNDMILKYAAVCGIYRIPKNPKSCD